MRRRLFLASALAPLVARADWRHSQAFGRLYNLDFDAAITLLEQDAAREPRNPDHLNNLAYAILYRTLFAADALDGNAAMSVSDYLRSPKIAMSAADRARFTTTLTQAEAVAKSLGETPTALYALGVTETHRANQLLLIDKHWRTALKHGGEARRLHTRVLDLDKNFVDAMLVPSFHEYIVGSLPIYMRAIGSIVGFTGDKNKGINGVRTVSLYGDRARIEATVLLALIENREEHPEKVIEQMRALERDFPTNHLYRRELAHLLLAAKRKDEARATFAGLADSRYKFLTPAQLAIYQRAFDAKLRA